eukprot:scaffold8290_cov174-Amphora_coffeaeformis.AAC.3
MGWYQEFIGDSDTPSKIYHLCPKDDWEKRPVKFEYAPPSYEQEKLVRTTHEVGRLTETANCFYKDKSPPTVEWVCLEIDTLGLRMNQIEMKMIESDMDPTLKCPHVYGKIPEEVIRNVYPVQRDLGSGEFLFVTGLTDACQSHANK